MKVLGFSAFFHNSAAALIEDGKILAFVAEERFTRKKNDGNFPFHAIQYCLQYANIEAKDLDEVVYYTDPVLAAERFADSIYRLGEEKNQLWDSTIHRVEKRLWVREEFVRRFEVLGKKNRLLVVRHHMSHAASAFYPSPYQKAVIITIDGVGEWDTLTIGRGCGREIEILETIRYPDSLGLFYSALSYFCGFKVNSGEYKFMGLAPYGRPVYKEKILSNLIFVQDDGSFQLNMDYFSFDKGKEIIDVSEMEALFGGRKREFEADITQRDIDIAASAQVVLEEIIWKIVCHAKSEHGEDIDNLVLAGGVALNCVCNGKIARSNIFKNVWVQPAADDAGGALGAALYAYYQLDLKAKKLEQDQMQGTFLGPSYTDEEVKTFLEEKKQPYKCYFKSQELFDKIADYLEQELVIGIFSGRMEAGPRALGHRSIIADARPIEMQTKLNKKIKNRESFRPFAPAVMKEFEQEYFEEVVHSPYMTYTSWVRKEKRMDMPVYEKKQPMDKVDLLEMVRFQRSDIPAVTHVDYSARIQSVSREDNAFFWNILKAFYDKSGCPLVVNTSFNVRGEPIVCSLEDAYRCFLKTQMDVLVLENYIVVKGERI